MKIFEIIIENIIDERTDISDYTPREKEIIAKFGEQLRTIQNQLAQKFPEFRFRLAGKTNPSHFELRVLRNPAQDEKEKIHEFPGSPMPEEILQMFVGAFSDSEFRNKMKKLPRGKLAYIKGVDSLGSPLNITFFVEPSKFDRKLEIFPRDLIRTNTFNPTNRALLISDEFTIVVPIKVQRDPNTLVKEVVVSADPEIVIKNLLQSTKDSIKRKFIYLSGKSIIIPPGIARKFIEYYSQLSPDEQQKISKQLVRPESLSFNIKRITNPNSV